MGNYELIGVYDYNPVHAIWYVLVNQLGMSTDWIDSTSFLSAAETVYNEGKGVGIRQATHDDAVTYIKNLLSHIEGLLYYGVDGKLHMTLIRYDYTVGSLPVVDSSSLLSEPNISRDSFNNTYGEIKVQYNQRVVELLSETNPSLYYYSRIPKPRFEINGSPNYQVLDIRYDEVTFQAWTPSFYEDGEYVFPPETSEGEETGYPVQLIVVFRSVAKNYTYSLNCTNNTLEMTEADMETIGPTMITRSVPYVKDNPLQYNGYEIEWIFGVYFTGIASRISIGLKECYARLVVTFPDAVVAGPKASINLGFTGFADGDWIDPGYIGGHYYDGGGR